MEPLILATRSPLRQEYFRLLGLPFTVMSPDADESFAAGLSPAEVTALLARKKIRCILEMPEGTFSPWICSADTAIGIDGEVLGKPADRAEAQAMLRRLQGRSHQAVTSVALYRGGTKTFSSKTVETVVTFAPLLDAEIGWYLDSGEWRGAAGAYRIQGLAACFIESIQGSFSSVAGLPLRELYSMLRENGYSYGAQAC